MKRYGNIYEKIYDYDNLLTAHHNARKGKGFYREVQEFNENEDKYIKKIQEMLINKTYKTSDYTIFTITDRGKEREIYKLPYFPDRVVQWAIMLQIEPIFLETFIYDSYAAIPKKGIHIASKRLSKWLKYDEENTSYCFKMDIKKFFPNIDHLILKQLLRRKIKDKDVLELLDEIIDSTEDGIPIGNYISQYLANFYITYFDHWAKEELGIKYYMRYMDDIVVLHSSKEYLHQTKKEIEKYLLNELQLTIKDNWQVFPVDVRGIDFMGYRHFRNYKLLRKSTYKNFRKKMNEINKKNRLSDSDMCSIKSYEGWLMWCDSYNLRSKYIQLRGDFLKRFSDFAQEEPVIDGSKIKMNDILDKEVEVLGYKLANSKYKSGEECLIIQFKLGSEKHIVFTGSSVLIEQCKKYKDEMPFLATIKQVDKYYTFS